MQPPYAFITGTHASETGLSRPATSSFLNHRSLPCSSTQIFGFPRKKERKRYVVGFCREGEMAERRDACGNPIPEHRGYGGAGREGVYGSGTAAPHEGMHGEGHGQQQQQKEEHHGGLLHRSGSSSSSSSSEDDGQGGRRKKKGLKEKVKEKLPGGGRKSEEHGQTAKGEQGKKGIMEKIKEKLPGHH